VLNSGGTDEICDGTIIALSTVLFRSNRGNLAVRSLNVLRLLMLTSVSSAVSHDITICVSSASRLKPDSEATTDAAVFSSSPELMVRNRGVSCI